MQAPQSRENPVLGDVACGDAGHYYDESVVAVCVTEDNQHMITGDSEGIVRTWALDGILRDLINGCEDGDIADDAVIPVARWRAHRGSIGSFATFTKRPNLLLSCGTDCLVSVWTLQGARVGTYGQVHCHASISLFCFMFDTKS
jgi:WD40 repeat protein